MPYLILSETKGSRPRGKPIRLSGQIVALDEPVVVGSLDITIQAETALPGAFAMFSGGLGVISLLGRRRKPQTEIR
jgi:hypothetical protein